MFPKQEEFFLLDNRICVFSGGIQSSKTTTGALRFLHHGLLQHRDKDDNFIIAADTYKTLSQATIPTFMKFAKQYGKFVGGAHEFRSIYGPTIFFRTATEPDSVEGIPNVRRVWLDEGGKVSRYFFENLMGRAARIEAPIDITSTPYARNWLYDIVMQAKNGQRDDVAIVHCRSNESPYFSKKEYERQRQLLDPRRFAMKYNGEFGDMVGLVYDVYKDCLVRSFPMPPGTKYYAGVDWGYSPDPFALVVRAVTPEKKHYRVAEYYKTYHTISDIVNVIRSYHAIYHFDGIVCDPSQPAHIAELCRYGLNAFGADNEIRLGIDRHYELMKRGDFYIFSDMNPIGIDEYATLHYPEERELGVDESLRKKDRLPVDANNHGTDCDRYLSMHLLTAMDKTVPKVVKLSNERPEALADKIAWLKKGGTRQYSGV